jgi:hypothetical protein
MESVVYKRQFRRNDAGVGICQTAGFARLQGQKLGAGNPELDGQRRPGIPCSISAILVKHADCSCRDVARSPLRALWSRRVFRFSRLQDLPIPLFTSDGEKRGWPT